MAFNPASLKKLARVNPDLVKICELAEQLCDQPFQIVQGNRTQAEQNALYAQGRTKPGPIVTWTKASKHIGGRAIDFAALVNNKINWNTKYYPKIAESFKAAAEQLGYGVEWGGDWKTKDWGHIQLTPKHPTPAKPTAGIGWTIADIQNSLVKHGFDPGTVDGILGSKTRAAIKKFQASQGLAQSGGADADTLRALAKKPGQVAVPQALLSTALPEEPVQQQGARWAIDYFERLGWTRLQATALVANLIWESGGRGDKIVWDAHGDAGHSHGAGQWNDRLGRFQNLQAFARDRMKDWKDPESQLRFMDHELRSLEGKARKRLMAAQTLDEAMEAALSYWRPSIPHLDKRKLIAQRLAKEAEA